MAVAALPFENDDNGISVRALTSVDFVSVVPVATAAGHSITYLQFLRTYNNISLVVRA